MLTGPATVLVERDGVLARLSINRPPLNILDLETLRELRTKLEEVMRDDGVRVIEIRGARKKSFSAGTDVRDHFRDRAPEMLREFHALIRAVLYSPRPTLAVVEGHCLGGGMELAMACDFIIASRDARFGQPEIGLGCFPPVAAVLLPRMIPEKRAMEMILTGQLISAREAFQLGLVNRVVDKSKLEGEVRRFRNAVLAHHPQVLAFARRSARLGSREGFEAALREAERLYLDELLQTEDAEEGLRAFLEKRLPKWSNASTKTAKKVKA